jgi:hypothetical protein
LSLEEVLVDLAVVDGDALLDAKLDDRLAIDAELLRELLGRQVVRHPVDPPSSIKKARRRNCAQSG